MTARGRPATGRRNRILLAGTIVLLCLCPLVVRAALNGGWIVTAVATAALQLLLLAGVATVAAAAWVRVLVMAVALAGLWVAVELGGVGSVLLASGVPHAVAYGGLLASFASSLDREPVVTRAARALRGTLSPEIERYTRSVTIAWCGFFAAQLGLSAALLTAAPLTVWALFVGTLNMPSVVLMILVEYAVRRLRFPAIRHTGMWRGIRTLSAQG